ncbi:MAG: hypothetical protein LBQ02_00915 [Candidatus Nomurabacteria bacterium]|nr:hypothetical protein [Candidatus Nomurabacteria bacterium]
MIICYKKRPQFDNVVDVRFTPMQRYDGRTINLDEVEEGMEEVISETFSQLNAKCQGLLMLDEIYPDGTGNSLFSGTTLTQPVNANELTHAKRILKRKFVDFRHHKKLFEDGASLAVSKDKHTIVTSAKTENGMLTASYYDFASATSSEIGRPLTTAALLYSSFSFFDDDDLCESLQCVMEEFNRHDELACSIVESALEKVYSPY